MTLKPNPKPSPETRNKPLRATIDQVLGSRFGRLLERVGFAPKAGKAVRGAPAQLIDLAESLLSFGGKASGASLASAFFDLYEASSMVERMAFLTEVRARFPRDGEAITKAIAGWQASPDENTAKALHKAAESRCQKLIRTLNLAPGGTRRLIHMRADLLSSGKLDRARAALDADFEYVFAGWFNAGFLELRRIDWDTPAAVLERVIRYEAVHSIDSWDDLRARVEPADRRCYAFFHPQMPDDPLIFVEVALTQSLPQAIGAILDEGRTILDPRKASHAIFYSISNCQQGLRGVPFGNYLIKQVAGLLQSELPQLSNFATLSPVPGFARWLEKQPSAGERDPQRLRAEAARYLVTARADRGGPLDGVAKFHLGNGARLEAVHAGGDPSPKGLKQSHGVMVNYLYDLESIEANLLSLSALDTVPCSKTVTALVQEAQVPTGRMVRTKAA